MKMLLLLDRFAARFAANGDFYYKANVPALKIM